MVQSHGVHPSFPVTPPHWVLFTSLFTHLRLLLTHPLIPLGSSCSRHPQPATTAAPIQLLRTLCWNPQKNVRPETPAEGREQSCVWSLFQQHSSHLRVAKSYTAPAYLSSPSGTLASSIPSYYHIALFPPCLHITIVTLQRIASRQSSHKQIISSLNSKTQISFHLLSSRHVKANTIFL